MGVLIVPAAGLSTRYGLSRPKFLLEHPSGMTMLTAGLSEISGLSNSGIEKILIVSLQDHFRDISPEKFCTEVTTVTGLTTEIMLLESGTSSMVETVCIALDHLERDDYFLVKDCDNLVAVDVGELVSFDNALCFADLRRHPTVAAHNKSFVSFGPENTLNSIIEKKIVGPQINVGLIKFESASGFLSAAKSLVGSRETFVSDVIRVLIGRGSKFTGIEVSQYEDWGTLSEWRAYCGSFATLFVDIDGVLAVNENRLARVGGWDRLSPIEDNYTSLIELQSKNRTSFVFTTSRSGEFRSQVEKRLRDLGFNKFQLIMDLPHSQRILINDFAPTNPFPSAVAISIPRNSASLSEYLPRSLG